MSDSGVTGAAAPAADGKTEMPQGDIDFIMCCIKNAQDGELVVNIGKIAAALGYSNVRSVTNRLTQIKKKWGIAMSGTGAKRAPTKSKATTPEDPEHDGEDLNDIETPPTKGKAAAKCTPKNIKVSQAKVKKTPITKAKAGPKLTKKAIAARAAEILADAAKTTADEAEAMPDDDVDMTEEGQNMEQQLDEDSGLGEA